MNILPKLSPDELDDVAEMLVRGLDEDIDVTKLLLFLSISIVVGSRGCTFCIVGGCLSILFTCAFEIGIKTALPPARSLLSFGPFVIDWFTSPLLFNKLVSDGMGFEVESETFPFK